MTKKDQILNMLGLAMRAGKLSTGEELVINDVRKNKARLVIISEDASANTNKTVTNKCESYHVPCITFGTRYEIGYAIGKAERVSIAILDAGFAKKIRSLYSDMNEERTYE